MWDHCFDQNDWTHILHTSVDFVPVSVKLTLDPVFGRLPNATRSEERLHPAAVLRKAI